MKKYKLGEIATIEISGVDKKVKEGEIPVKLCNFVDVYYNWAVAAPMYPQFMEATARQSEIDRFTLHKGQVALTKDSETRFDIGISTYIADDFDNVILGYHNALITPNPDFLNGKYLNALLHTEYARTYFANNASGSGQRYALSVDALNSFPVYLPSIEEQERIGNIFSTIDRKIELNREINRNLEAQAKQLYDYWFVQFDFPDENGKPYKSSGGEMDYNDILKKEVPMDWNIVNLGNHISKLSSGKRPSGGIDKSLTTGIPSLGAECIDKLGVFDYSSTPYIPFSYKDQIHSGIIENNDILIYKDGAYVGKTTLFRDNFPFEFATVNEHVFLLKAENKQLQEYLFYTLNSSTYFEIMQLKGKAKAAQPGLNKDDINSIQILLPTNDVLSKFTKQIESIHKLLFANSLQIAKAQKLRDELLPLLMNGQVSIMPTEVNCDLSHD